MRILILTTLFVFPSFLFASDVDVSQVEYIKSDNPRFVRALQFTVEWKNSWNNSRNHDAAWVFFKVIRNSGGSRHVYLGSGSMQLWKMSDDLPDPAIEITSDGTGLMIYPSGKYRGHVKYRVQVELDTARIDERYINYFNSSTIRGYGIEMVQIPEGKFTLGDPDTTALAFGGLYKSDDKGSFNGLYEVGSDEAIDVGPGRGNLFYRANEPEYQGDQKGPIPSTFPNGYSEFYLMKYEVNQGIYAEFLNTLGTHAASVRFTGGMPEYAHKGGSITLQDGRFHAGLPNQRMVYWHWEDMMAFTDWAALRPYTELEFTKAARGPLSPKAHEFAWNTDSYNVLIRRINNETHQMEMPGGTDESQLTESNRAQYGASYYWVMDLSGSMWEKLITIGDPVGRAFVGNHGDGQISYYGKANVEGWPEGYEEVQGYGYRGGGYYGKPDISDFNPYSPIAYRLYGAWSGGARNASYGYRAARTLK